MEFETRIEYSKLKTNNMKLKPLGNRVIIEEIIEAPKSVIIQPNAPKKEISKAKVIATGIECKETKVGDIILYDNLYVIKYEEVLIINENNIYSVIED